MRRRATAQAGYPDPVPPPTYVRYVGVPVLRWSPELGFLPC